MNLFCTALKYEKLVTKWDCMNDMVGSGDAYASKKHTFEVYGQNMVAAFFVDGTPDQSFISTHVITKPGEAEIENL